MMKQYDEIRIQNLEVFANHGVFQEETNLGQKFLFSLTMYTDTRKAGKSDCLEESIHYGEVSPVSYTHLDVYKRQAVH